MHNQQQRQNQDSRFRTPNAQDRPGASQHVFNDPNPAGHDSYRFALHQVSGNTPRRKHVPDHVDQ